jgi:hypothetical protein
MRAPFSEYSIRTTITIDDALDERALETADPGMDRADLSREVFRTFLRVQELAVFVEQERLYGLGCGVVDMGLLASMRITPGALLWTLDERLVALAERFGVACANPPHESGWAAQVPDASPRAETGPSPSGNALTKRTRLPQNAQNKAPYKALNRHDHHPLHLRQHHHQHDRSAAQSQCHPAGCGRLTHCRAQPQQACGLLVVSPGL